MNAINGAPLEDCILEGSLTTRHNALAASFKSIKDGFLSSSGPEKNAAASLAISQLGSPPPIDPQTKGFEGDLEYSGSHLTIACRNLATALIDDMALAGGSLALRNFCRLGWLGIAFPANSEIPLAVAIGWMGLERPAGRELAAELARSGAAIFPTSRQLELVDGREPLSSALRHGDEPAARAALDALGRMEVQDPQEFHPGLVNELLSLGAKGNESSPLFHKLAEENPARWSGAGSKSSALLFELWAAGEDHLAKKLLLADPKKAVNAMSRITGGHSPVEAAIAAKMSDRATLEAFGQLSLALEQLDANSDLKRIRQANPLHFLAEHFPERLMALAPPLLALGSNARQLDRDGATPIGLAASTLSWTELVDIFGARPQDLAASRQMRGDEVISSLLAATRTAPRTARGQLGQPGAEDAAFSAHAERVGGLLSAACSGGAIQSHLLAQCAAAAAARGFAKAFEAAAVEMRKRSMAIPASMFLTYVQAAPVNAMREAGMRDCLAIAVRLGMDINANATSSPQSEYSSPAEHTASTPEAKSLIYLLAERIQYDRPERSGKDGARHARANFLIECGADPRQVAPGEGFVTEHACWLDEFDQRTRDMVQSWIATFEERALRASLAVPERGSSSQKSAAPRAGRRSL